MPPQLSEEVAETGFSMNGNITSQVVDAVVVGAGFSGLSVLHELRKYGFSCKVFEQASGLGGVWYWSCYPGARVDSDSPIYQFHQPEIGRDFPWSARFPDQAEIQEYFSHVDKQHNFSRDIQFNTRVTGASFNSITNQWEVTTSSDAATTICRFLILCTGISSKRYRPEFPGIETFLGECHHTGDWTADRKVDFKNKRVAVVGTGASGVQVIQEVGPIVKHLTVLQRTPNLALPMRQQKQKDKDPKNWEFPPASDYSRIQESLLQAKPESYCVTATEEERTKFFEELYRVGGLFYWRLNYTDALSSLEANAHVYKFWRESTIKRIHDPSKRELLAPVVPPHPFGTKRPSLEQCYYEVFNQSNVDLVNVRKNPIKEITPQGIRLENGDEVNVDIIILATGYDLVTGGLLEMDIRNGQGRSLREHWNDGIRTYVGMLADEFPNFFFLCGPQSPTAFTNGPTVVKMQYNFLFPLLIWIRSNGKQTVEAKVHETEKWTAHVRECWDKSLFGLADSPYQGANIPGKKREPLCYSGGNRSYVQALEEASAENYVSFNFK